jgi:hypothetical protein
MLSMTLLTSPCGTNALTPRVANKSMGAAGGGIVGAEVVAAGALGGTLSLRGAQLAASEAHATAQERYRVQLSDRIRIGRDAS